jgi:hypothetical protein
MAQMSREPILIQENVMMYKKPRESHSYIMTVDVAKGRGQDYSTFNIIDVSTNPFQQVATFRDNTLSPLLFPDIIYKYAMTYNEAYVIIESNDQGSVVCNGLYYDLEYENMYVESSIKSGAIGATMTRRVKRIGCSTIKDFIEQRKLEIIDSETIIEMSTFVANGNSYSASGTNHDDLMMNLVMFGWFASTDIFQNLTNIDMKDLLYRERLKAIQDDMLPFGFINNGNDGYLVDEETGNRTSWMDAELWT